MLKRAVRIALASALVLAVGLLCLAIIAVPAGEESLRSYLRTHGTGDTGALNLVTAIYLGYRAFDTVGETIVLVLAVVGVGSLFVKQR